MREPKLLNWLYWYEPMVSWAGLNDEQTFPLGKEVYVAIAWMNEILAHINLTVRRRGLFFLKKKCRLEDKPGHWFIFGPIQFPLGIFPGAFIFDAVLTEEGKAESLDESSREVYVRAIIGD